MFIYRLLRLEDFVPLISFKNESKVVVIFILEEELPFVCVVQGFRLSVGVVGNLATISTERGSHTGPVLPHRDSETRPHHASSRHGGGEVVHVSQRVEGHRSRDRRRGFELSC